MKSQREFYERGYAVGQGLSPETLVAGFKALPESSRIRRAADLLRGYRGELLDVGCGSGALLYSLRCQFERMYGIDIASSQLQRANSWISMTRCRAEVFQMDLDQQDLPMDADTIDVVTCVVVLEFLVRPEAALAEMTRVLRPGGVLLVSVGNIVSWKNRLRAACGLDPRTTTFNNALNGGALHWFTLDLIKRLLRESGLTVDRVSCSGVGWRAKQIRPSLFAGDIIIRARKPIAGES